VTVSTRNAGVAVDIVPVTPDNTNYLASDVFGIMATGAGNVVMDTAYGTDRVIPFQSGQIIYIAARRIKTTSTATGIMALIG